MSDCKKVNKYLIPYLDNVLTAEEKKLVDEHINACQRCKIELSQLEETGKLISEYAKEEIPEPDSQKLKRQVIDKLDKKSIADIFRIKWLSNLAFLKHRTFAAITGLCLLIVAAFYFLGNEIKDNTILAYHNEAKEEYSRQGFVDYISMKNMELLFNKNLLDLIGISKSDVLDDKNELRKEIINLIEKKAGFLFYIPKIEGYRLVGCRIISEKTKQVQFVYKNHEGFFSLFESLNQSESKFKVKRIIRIQDYEKSDYKELWLMEWYDKNMRFILAGEFGEIILNKIKQNLFQNKGEDAYENIK